MKKSRFTEAQIVSILKDWDAGAAVAELARKHGVHANTLRLWRSMRAVIEKGPPVVIEMPPPQAVGLA